MHEMHGNKNNMLFHPRTHCIKQRHRANLSMCMERLCGLHVFAGRCCTQCPM